MVITHFIAINIKYLNKLFIFHNKVIMMFLTVKKLNPDFRVCLLCERDMCNYLRSVMTLEAHWLLAATLHYLDCCDNTRAGQCLKAAKHTNIDNVG